MPDEKITALIARLRDYGRDSLDPETRLEIAAALEASVQAPAVSREALIASLRREDHGPMSDHDPRDGSCRSCPWPVFMLPPEDIADSLIASGVLQDAAEVEARGLERFAQELLARVGPGVRHRAGSGAVFEFSPKGAETEFWGYENAVAYTGAVLEVLDMLNTRPDNLTATSYAGGRQEPRTLDEAVAELRAQQVRDG